MEAVMNKITAVIIILLLVLCTAGCGNDGNGDADGDVYDRFVVDAGYGGSKEMLAEAENAELRDGGRNEHLPVWRFDTLDEYEAFIEAYKDVLNTESLRMAHINAEYFSEYTLLLVYKIATSGSYRYDMRSFDVDEGKATVVITQTNHPESCTDDMAGWWIGVSMDKEIADGLTALDALGEDFE